MTRTPRPVRAFALALILVANSAAPAQAAPPGAAPPLAYWGDFVDHWFGKLRRQNGVVVAALGVGAISLFIITRGKWLK